MGAPKKPVTEGGIMREIMMRASECGIRIFRNNVGTGLVVRAKTSYLRELIVKALIKLAIMMGGSAARIKFGLCEGSGDTIGWRTIVVTQEMVGSRIAQFVSVEVKTGTGKSSTEQKQWAVVVEQAGGVAIVARSADDVAKIAPPMRKP